MVSRAIPLSKLEESSPKNLDSPGKVSKKQPQADFNQITTASLKNYKKTFKIRTRTAVNKSELVEVVTKHFAALPEPEDEDSIINGFLSAIKQQVKEREPGDSDTDIIGSQ